MRVDRIEPENTDTFRVPELDVYKLYTYIIERVAGFLKFTPKTRNRVLGSTRSVRAIDRSPPLLHQM